jgi:hypothetical protein
MRRQTMLSSAPTRNLSIVIPNLYLGMGLVARSEAEISPVSMPKAYRPRLKVRKFEVFAIKGVKRRSESFVIAVPLMSCSALGQHNGSAHREGRQARHRQG